MELGRHWTLLADAEGASGLTGRQLFMEALFKKRGMRSEAIRQTAVTDFTMFATNGNAPDYVQNFCIDKINQERNRKAGKALKKIVVPVGERLGPSQSDVEELTDCA